jgi:hypothetical protein
MVNRVLEVKVLKIKRRRMKLQGKFTSHQIASDRVVSLSKQIINVGLRVPGMSLKGPLDKAAYQFHNPKKRDLTGIVPESFIPKLDQVLSKDQDVGMKNRIIHTQRTWVYIFFDSLMKDIYLVRISFARQTVERSINYRTIAAAQEAVLTGNAVWCKHNPHEPTD